jgi:hypothetical protein
VYDTKKLVRVPLAQHAKELKAETAPDYRSRCQDSLLMFRQVRQPTGDKQEYVIRNLDLIDIDIAPKFALIVKDLSVIKQLPINLLEKKGVSLGFFKQQIHQWFRWLAAAQIC